MSGLVHLVVPAVLLLAAWSAHAVATHRREGRRLRGALGAAVAVGLGMTSLFAAAHRCHEGAPPLLLCSLLVASATAAATVVRPSVVRIAHLAVAIAAALVIPFWLVSLFHGADFTGNAETPSTPAWHTFLTGARRRG